MNVKLVKRLALLAVLLMLAVCLPVSSMAATTVTTKQDVMIGYNYITLDDVIVNCVEEIGAMRLDDRSEKLTFALEKVGKGITVTDSQMNYEVMEEDGETWYTLPYVDFTVDSAEAHGESIVFTVQVKPENKTYRCEVELSIIAVAKTPVVSATAATKLAEGDYGTYTITVEEGSFITITPVYEDMNGKKLAMETEWYTYDYENGYSDLLSKQNTHTFEVTKALDGDDLEWQVNLPSIGYGASSWIHLTVVPKGTLTASSAPVPSTGDNAAPMLWLAGMLMAGAGCAALMMKRRQNG